MAWLIEFMTEHVCHINNANVETILSDCKHQEEESWVYCKIGQILSLFCQSNSRPREEDSGCLPAQNPDLPHLLGTDATERGSPLFLHARGTAVIYR